MGRKKQNHLEVLAYLADGHWHSGQTMANLFNMTRSAIWKKIQSLQEMGIPIESVPGNGYRIPTGIELLDSQKILAELNPVNSHLLHQLIVLHEVDSTNTYLLKQSSEHKVLACLAEHQTAGRGRFGRHWVASFGRNIYFSLIWHFSCDPAEVLGLSPAIAVAVIRTLQKFILKPGLSLKWPNDVLYQGKKLAGILLEMVAEPHNTCSVVIGIGINADIDPQISSQITQPWTSLYQINGERPPRNHLAALLLNEILHALLQFEQQGLIPFLAEWRAMDHLYQQQINLYNGPQTITGVVQGISDKGELILEQAGKLCYFLSGEVSTRKRIE